MCVWLYVEVEFLCDFKEECGWFVEEVEVGVVCFGVCISSFEVAVSYADCDHSCYGVGEEFHGGVGFCCKASVVNISFFYGVFKSFDADDSCSFVEYVGEEFFDGWSVVSYVLFCFLEEWVFCKGC